MLNLAGSSFDFGHVLFAVLQECEHRRRGLVENDVEAGLRAVARQKLDEIRRSYEECGGTRSYWEDLEREVLDTALPQYVAAAREQNRLERTNYDLWRGGDPIARCLLGLAGLTLGGIIIKLPFIPIFEDSFAFALALGGFLYPEIKRLIFDYRHSRLLNRLIVQAEKYQKNSRIHYVSNAQLEQELSEVGTGEKTAAGADAVAAPHAEGTAAPAAPAPHRDRPGGKGGRHRG
jgi:hypothetical protein